MYHNARNFINFILLYNNLPLLKTSYVGDIFEQQYLEPIEAAYVLYENLGDVVRDPEIIVAEKNNTNLFVPIKEDEGAVQLTTEQSSIGFGSCETKTKNLKDFSQKLGCFLSFLL